MVGTYFTEQDQLPFEGQEGPQSFLGHAGPERICLLGKIDRQIYWGRIVETQSKGEEWEGRSGFLNESSDCPVLSERMQTHTGNICLASLHCVVPPEGIPLSSPQQELWDKTKQGCSL